MKKGRGLRIPFITIIIGVILIGVIYSLVSSSKKVVYPTEYPEESVKGTLDSLHVDGFELKPGTTKWSEIREFFGKASKEETENDGTYARAYDDKKGKYNRMVMEFTGPGKEDVLKLAYVEYSNTATNIYVADELAVTGVTTDTFKELYPDAEAMSVMGFDEYKSESGVANTVIITNDPLGKDVYAICVVLNEPNQEWHIY